MSTAYVNVIMVGHRSLAGKDTAAGFLKDYGFTRKAFADKLKNSVADLYDFTTEQMYGEFKDVVDLRYPNTLDSKTMLDPAYDEWEMDIAQDNGVELESMFIPDPNYKPFLTPRRVLQKFGQDQRAIYPDIWAQCVFNDIDREVGAVVNSPTRDIKVKSYVITDFRFKNESEVAYRWLNKELPRIRKRLFPIKIDRPGVFAKSGADDISEHDLDDFKGWHKVIMNDAGLPELQAKIKQLVEVLGLMY